MSRPLTLVIAGTGTEVGKTWFGSRVLSLARAAGWQVAARKPAQSYDPSESQPTDAEILAVASGESFHDVCPAHRWYPLPMAPPMAADALAQPRFDLDTLVNELSWPSAARLRVLEIAGGLCSPIAHDADNLQLIRRVAPHHVVLVADAGLGTINAVRLSLMALAQFKVSIYLNRFDPTVELHRRNRDWLLQHETTAAFTDVRECWAALQRTAP